MTDTNQKQLGNTLWKIAECPSSRDSLIAAETQKHAALQGTTEGAAHVSKAIARGGGDPRISRMTRIGTGGENIREIRVIRGQKSAELINQNVHTKQDLFDKVYGYIRQYC